MEASESGPRFSIVVPAYNVQAWIRACLESIVAQTFDDFEVLIIDDRGTDRSVAIAREFERDSRFRVVSMPENGGLGPARNLGIDHARGDYVLFVDSDDLLRVDALERIEATLDDRGDVDIVLYDYCRLNWWGTARPNSNNQMLREFGGRTVTVDDAPRLLKNFHVAWNKAYRRAWLAQTGVRFYPGYYEDVPWTYPLMMAAKSVAVLPEGLYFYRQRFDGSILNSKSSRHLEVLEQYERMFDEASKLDNFELHAGALFDQFIFHIRSMVRAGMDRIPRRDKPRFYRESAKLIRRYQHLQPASTPPLVRRRTQLLGSPGWPLFPALKTASSAVREVRTRWGRFLKLKPVRRVRLRCLRMVHATARMLPTRQPVAVYMSYWGNSQSCNPNAIYEQQLIDRPEVDSYWILKRSAPAEVDADRRVVPGTMRERWLMGRATQVVSNVNPPDWWVKRADCVHLQTQHGTPLKIMGIHLRGTPSGPKISYTKLLNRCARWDFCLSSNPFSTETWPSAFPVSFDALEAGYPRNDPLYDDSFLAAARKKVRSAYGIPDDAFLLLHAPTFREYEKTFTMHIDWPEVLDALPTNVYVAVRAHHSYGTDGEAPHPRLANVSSHRLVEELYAAADVLVTDYSSVMFDYANLGRPIIIAADDYETYESHRGFYFDIRDHLGLSFVTSDRQLVDFMVSERYQDADVRAQLEQFRATFCPFDDGAAAERVVEAIFR